MGWVGRWGAGCVYGACGWDVDNIRAMNGVYML